jgi:cytochrome c oxidase assembly factor 3
MRRARQPFRVKNAITGVLLAAFGVGVWAYSISAVKQDVFDDVDEEAKALAAARRQSLTEQDEAKAGKSTASS